MKILLCGGGSGGPVSPLLAVAAKIKETQPKAKFLLVGTGIGPAKLMAEKAGLEFTAIAEAKLRRYFSWKNFLSPITLIIGFFQAWKILKQFKPNCVFGAGSFVQVPVAWAAYFQRIPVILHQQDLVASLANQLCQFTAKKITVTFPVSATEFSTGAGFFYKRQAEKVVVTGNPFREELKDGSKEEAIKFFHLNKNLPTLLVLGGGTGAEFFNKLIAEALPQLSKTVQIIHAAGLGKMTGQRGENYHPYEFISNMGDAYAIADIVLSRAGLSTLTELSNLKKLSIIVPMPRSHQETNAMFINQRQAAITLAQSKISAAGFTALIRKLLFAPEAQDMLKKNMGELMPKNSAKKIAEIIIKLALNT